MSQNKTPKIDFVVTWVDGSDEEWGARGGRGGVPGAGRVCGPLQLPDGDAGGEGREEPVTVGSENTREARASAG